MPKIMAYGEPDEAAKKFVLESLYKDKISRFLYSWIPNCDLRRLANMQINQMTADEKEIWRRGRRLLSLQAGDFILHKNLPERGIVTAARICSEYFYDPDPKPLNEDGRKDGRHCFHVDKVFEFRRSDVHPQLRTKLNVMGSLYKIPDEKEFYQSMLNLGMPFDEQDREAAAILGVNLSPTDKNFSADDKNEFVQSENYNSFTPKIATETFSSQESDSLSPIKKILHMQENYLNGLINVIRNLPPNDSSRKEILGKILEALRMFSPDTLKKIVSELFTENGYRLLGDEHLMFEIFSEREVMHAFYKVDNPQRIFVCVKSFGISYEEIFSKFEASGNHDMRLLIDLVEKFDEDTLTTAEALGVILIDGLTFANALARYKV